MKKIAHDPKENKKQEEEDSEVEESEFAFIKLFCFVLFLEVKFDFLNCWQNDKTKTSCRTTKKASTTRPKVER